MKRELFNLSWAALLSVLLSERITADSQKVYFEILQEIPDDLWQQGVRKILQGNRFFPTINELGAACCGEQKEQTVWREDPWRGRQHYAERLPEISWQRNLERIMEQRKALNAPVEEQKIEPPEKPDYVTRLGARGNPTVMRELVQYLEEQLNRKQTEREKEQEADRQKKREEAKEKLKEQARFLGVDNP